MCYVNRPTMRNIRIELQFYVTLTMKTDTGAPITGYSPLIDILTRASDEHNADSVLKNISRTLNKYRNPIPSQLDSTVTQELSKHSFEVVCYSPFNFVIAHSEKKQILSGTINTARRTKDNEKSEHFQFLWQWCITNWTCICIVTCKRYIKLRHLASF